MPVEAPDRVDPFTGSILNFIHNRIAVPGIIGCGNGVFGLIQQNVNKLLEADLLPVNLYPIRWLDLHPHLGYHLTVYLHLACLNIFVGITSRTESTVGYI